jgi:hypothetical protein
MKSAAEWFAEMPDDDDAAWTEWLHRVQADALEAAAQKAMTFAKPIGPLIAKGEDEGPMGMLLPSWIAKAIRALKPKPEEPE